MVSSGQVTSDLNSLLTQLNNYSSHIGDLASNWKGPSYDNLSSKAEEFVSEYTSAISDGMNSFANACTKYEEYIAVKREIEQLQTALAATDDPAEQASIREQINILTEKKEALKTEIESFLAKASSVSLTANAVSIPTPSAIAEIEKKKLISENQKKTSKTNSKTKNSKASSSSSNGKSTSNKHVSRALAAAASIARSSRGYSKINRWGNPNYDCSSYVITCWEKAGVPVKSKYGASYTGNMRKAFINAGFKCYRLSPNKRFTLKPGDVLLNEGVHAAMYYGKGRIIDATQHPANGDQIGTRRNSSAYGWQYVLRYNG